MIMSKNEIKETEEKEQVEKFFKTKVGLLLIMQNQKLRILKLRL